MSELKQVKKAFAAANEFLSPVLQRDELQKSRGKSLLEILAQRLTKSLSDDASIRANVIERSLTLLYQIHVAFVAPVNDTNTTAQDFGEPEDADLEDARRRRILHALLDLISLEGIYPSLSAGVGIPLQQRVISVLPAGVIAQQHSPAAQTPQDMLLLQRILTTLFDILLDARPSIQPVIRGRILSDIISAASDLGYNPTALPGDKQKPYRDTLMKIVEDTQSAVILPTLTNFLQSNPAPWFKSVVSAQLSRVPLRPGGVLQTIVFLASQFAPSLGQEAQAPATTGPHITVNAIMHASRLLSSVPQDVDPVDYLSVIGPQLLTLIDGGDSDLRRAGAYVAGNGILGKRAYGAPGTIGYSIFLEPIFKALTGSLDESSRAFMPLTNSTMSQSPDNTLSSEAEVILAVNRLKTLVLQPPNPGLVKRVVHPILLPLWGLACFTKEHEIAALHENIMMILQTYFGISVGFPPLRKIIDDFLWNGSPAWTYGLDSKGKVLLRKRSTNDSGYDLVGLVDKLQLRARLFMNLLGADPSRDEVTGEVFLYASENWLAKPSNTGNNNNNLQLLPDPGTSRDIVRRVVCAKLAETLLDTFKDTLTRRPLRVLELIKQIIDGEVNETITHRERKMREGLGTVSLSSLSNIVPSQLSHGQGAEPESDSSDSMSTVFSLLSTIIASPEFSASQETVLLLETIKEKLDALIPYLPQSISKSGTTASMLLEIHLTSPEMLKSESAPAEIPDFETHRRALSSLNSDLPPVQAEGFTLLSQLIKKGSPILDIPSTLTLLLSIIMETAETAANDEYIYLNAIKLIGTLASRHPRTVIKTLMERYIDKNEKANLDQRLKIGESLLRTVQDLGEALTGEAAKILGDGLISVAGRRAYKPEAHKNRIKSLENERRRKERDDRQKTETSIPPGWKLSSNTAASNSPDNLLVGEEDSESETPEQAAHSANIISAWAAGASPDDEPDDLRVRASALSILATAIQSNILGFSSSIVSSSVELALSTLTLESDLESAILRRASAVLLLDILKALDTARESGKQIGFGFSLLDEGNKITESRGPRTIGNIPSMLRTLAFVESHETDSIVRGHIRVLVESLEAWIEKSLLWGIGDQSRDQMHEPRLELGNQIAGLSINPLEGRKGDGMRPRIEEIE